MNRRVLIVSPHFPPTNAPDHQRIRMCLPYFSEFGWEPVVLAVDAGHVDAPRDQRLADSLPPSVEIHRIGAWSKRWTRLAAVGSLGYRAWFPLKARGRALLASGRFDLVYFSTTQFLLTALGRAWQREFGVPYVVDIQDPWLTDYYSRPDAPRAPGGWKYRLARWQAARLEERSWQGAAGFISVSPRYLEELGRRYAWFAGKPAEVIPFGVAESDFETVRADETIVPAFTRRPGCLHLASVGAAGPIMREALDALFAGVALLRARAPEAAAQLRFHFVGTSYATGTQAAATVTPIAASHGVADLVEERPTRIGYFESIKTMLTAHALLLPGSNDPSYSPSKIAACFLTGRPVLALLPEPGVAHARVRALGFASTVVPGSMTAPDEIANWLAARLSGEPPDSSRNATQFAAEETARAGARRQCVLFERALQGIR